MGSGQWILLVVLVVLILFSAFFSASETAFSCVNKIRLKNLESNGNKRASRVLKVVENYDKFLSTVLVGNNIVNITAATLATILFTSLIANASLATTLSTIVTTTVVLIFGEITPKSIAKEKPESFAMFAEPIIKFIAIILWPINIIFVGWKKLLSKIFKFKKQASITEDELITIVETAHNEGGINDHESELIRSAIEFNDLTAEDVMVPRVNITAVEENEQFDVISEEFTAHGFSRLPVYVKSIDSIVGIIHEKDFNRMLNRGEKNLKSIIQSSLCVSPNMKISNVLKMLQKAKMHMAVVIDEFGGTAGLVTLEDIIEELVGEIWDEHDEVEILYKRVDDNTFIVSGSENLEDMFDELGVKTRDEFDSTTVGGWVTEQLERIPVPGEKFNYMNLEITVMKANAKRILEVKVKIFEPEQDDEQE